jgi:hypothetical protein
MDKLLDESRFDEVDGQFGDEWFDSVFEDCFIDTNIEVERPEVLISIGEYKVKGNLYPIPVMTAGEMSCIVAPSKSKKSFIKSVICASYILGDSSNYFPNIKGHRDKDYYIFDFDTEQSKYYSSKTFQRTIEMVGFKYSNYVPFCLRKLSTVERYMFIDRILESDRYKGKVKIIFIDGIADLVDNDNDPVESKKVAGYLMKWTSQFNIHICTVIHSSWGTNKATGHLGSSMVKKAETVMLLTPTDESKDVIKVEHQYNRGYKFEEFHFKINDYNAMPYKVNDITFEIESPNLKELYREPKQELPNIEINDAFDVPF